MKAPRRHQFNFSKVKRVVWVLLSALGPHCHLQQWEPTVSLQRAVFVYQKPGLFGNFYLTPLVNNSTECTLLPSLEVSPVYKRCPVEILCPQLLGVLIRITSIHSTNFPSHHVFIPLSKYPSPHNLSHFSTVLCPSMPSSPDN